MFQLLSILHTKHSYVLLIIAFFFFLVYISVLLIDCIMITYQVT